MAPPPALRPCALPSSPAPGTTRNWNGPSTGRSLKAPRSKGRLRGSFHVKPRAHRHSVTRAADPSKGPAFHVKRLHSSRHDLHVDEVVDSVGKWTGPVQNPARLVRSGRRERGSEQEPGRSPCSAIRDLDQVAPRCYLRASPDRSRR